MEAKKRYYIVTFKCRNEKVFCTNIVHAENMEKVEAEYAKYGWYHAREVPDDELEAARRKGMPFIEL